jgi:hypothetical protein
MSTPDKQFIDTLLTEVAELRRERDDLRCWLKASYKQQNTPARRKRYHPHRQTDWPTSDLK